MKARLAAGILVGMCVAFGATGCTFVTPQSTLLEGETSNGVNGQTGDIGVRNATLISDNEGKSASLLASFVNQSDRGAQIRVQYKSASGETIDGLYYVAGRQTLNVGAKGQQQIVLTNLDSPAGSLYPVYFQTGSAPGKQLLVPVLSSAWEEYAGLAPNVR